MTTRDDNMKLFIPGPMDDAALVSTIARVSADLNDMVRLAMARGLTVFITPNKTVVDAIGTRLDPISIRITKTLL